MRPPQFAGESEAAFVDDLPAVLASMRPPQFAGESDAARDTVYTIAVPLQ